MTPSYRPSDMPPPTYEVPAIAPSSPTPVTLEAPKSTISRPFRAWLAPPLVKRFLASFAVTMVVGGAALTAVSARGTSLSALVGSTPKPVVVRGSSTVAELAGPLSAALQSTRPELAIRYETSSSAAGIGALVRGEVELAASSRPATEAEKSSTAHAGHPLTEHVIAKDGIAVVVHPDNPVSEMTLDQLRAVLTGRVTSWAQLGGRNVPIAVLLRPEEQGSHEVIKAAVLDHGEVYAPGAEVVRRTEDVVARVKVDPGAVGYLSFLGTGSAKTLKLTAGSVNPVPPSAATIRSGAYPLRRDLFLYMRNDASPRSREIVRFLLGPGQGVVREAGFVTPE